MANFKKQKGISIVLIILISSFIFAIALGINSISYQQAKTMKDLGLSVVSFFAADAGAEKQLFNLYKETSISSSFNVAFESSFPAYASTSVRCSLTASNCLGITVDASCAANNFCVNSVGNYKGLKRAIELKY